MAKNWQGLHYCSAAGVALSVATLISVGVDDDMVVASENNYDMAVASENDYDMAVVSENNHDSSLTIAITKWMSVFLCSFNYGRNGVNYNPYVHQYRIDRYR